MNAGPTGALFGSVTATNVADRLWEQEKIRVDRRKLDMETIKRIGRYRVAFEIFTDVVVELKVAVAPEGQELPPEEELLRSRRPSAPRPKAPRPRPSRAQGRRGRDRGRDRGRGRGGGRRSPAPTETSRRRRPGRAPVDELPKRLPGKFRPQALHGPVDDCPRFCPQMFHTCGTCVKVAAKSAHFVHYPSDEQVFYNPCIDGSFDTRGAAIHTLQPRRKPGLLPSTWPQPAQALSNAPVPPQNLDAEESVLGAMMLSPRAIGAVTESTNLDASDFYRESHGHIYRATLSLYAKGEPVDAITRRRRARGARQLEGGGRGAHARARGARPGGVERGALRADRPRDGDAARADPRRQRHRAPRLRPARRDDRARRPRRADRVRPLAAARLDGEFAHIDELLKESFETITKLYEAGSDITGTPSGLPRPRPADLRLPAGQPDHRRGAPVDGEVGARALHGGERRRAPRASRSRCSRSRCRSRR